MSVFPSFEKGEKINKNLLFEVGSLLFLSFETNIRGSMAKMMVETAIPTRPQILVSTKENSEASMSLSMILVKGSDMYIQVSVSNEHHLCGAVLL